MSQIVASLQNATKRYKTGDTEITALSPTSIELKAGELTLIIGPSGSGKTTLLSLLGCVIYPTEGKVFINDIEINKLKESKLAEVRLKYIGFIFQSMNLLAPLTAYENVLMPLQLLNVNGKEANERVIHALDTVGMMDRKNNKPKQLSGGQQQRVAIARALVTNPLMLLCDEPTAALDSKSMLTVMTELKSLSKQGKSVAVVTHDPRLKEYADRVVAVENGAITSIV